MRSKKKERERHALKDQERVDRRGSPDAREHTNTTEKGHCEMAPRQCSKADVETVQQEVPHVVHGSGKR
jgi:hypothetical protein